MRLTSIYVVAMMLLASVHAQVVTSYGLQYKRRSSLSLLSSRSLRAWVVPVQTFITVYTYIHLCHVQTRVNKAVDGKHATITTISAGGASGVSTGAAAGGEASNDINMAAGPSQQPAKANPPDQVCAC